ncbi:MAG: four helix bundle protein [Chitinophagales bacterium]|nr:four helix bundle protein [Chitinophagales bacterium]
MQDLKERTFAFAVAVGKLVQELPYSTLNKAFTSQLIRPASSVGANYRAARRAESEADFIHKLKIVEEEIDESVYFLELLKRFNPSYDNKTDYLIDEGTQILRIIVSSINKALSK